MELATKKKADAEAAWERHSRDEGEESIPRGLEQEAMEHEKKADILRHRKNRKATANRIGKEGVYRDAGLTKVRGAQGGTYYE
jgi:hypothetical protein